VRKSELKKDIIEIWERENGLPNETYFSEYVLDGFRKCYLKLENIKIKSFNDDATKSTAIGKYKYEQENGCLCNEYLFTAKLKYVNGNWEMNSFDKKRIH
jgi:hypothetical protein